MKQACRVRQAPGDATRAVQIVVLLTSRTASIPNDRPFWVAFRRCDWSVSAQNQTQEGKQDPARVRQCVTSVHKLYQGSEHPGICSVGSNGYIRYAKAKPPCKAPKPLHLPCHHGSDSHSALCIRAQCNAEANRRHRGGGGGGNQTDPTISKVWSLQK